AGHYTATSAEYTRDDGSVLPLGLYVRRSLAEHLDPDEILDVTRQGFDFFESVFDQPYPFSKYDQLFVPEFSAGAMENPGCVTFSEAYVFRSRVTDAQRERRAETILHEMAHMWFGDLVTMRWWDDLWLNESFATFMSQLALIESTRWTQAWVTFLDALKAWAKQQDQLPSTHPVADDMPDVESVHQNFDGITYAKGASVLRQLVAWVGQDEFFAGCRQYFADHAWDNTDLADFLAALERASGRDLEAWRDEWLLTTGVNELVPRIQLDGTNYASVAIEQRDEAPTWAGLAGLPDHTPVLRRHRIAVGVYDRTSDGLVRRERVEVDVEGERTPVDALTGVRAGDVLLLNDDDLTYAKVRLDADTTRAVVRDLHTFVDPLPRALVWSTAWDMVRDARMPTRRFVEMIRENLDHETVVGVVQRLQLRAIGAVERYAAPDHRAVLLSQLADQASTRVEAAEPGSDLQLAWVRHWASAAGTDQGHLAAVARLLDGDLRVDGLEVDTDLRWHLVTCLAQTGAIDDARIDEELARDPTDLGARHAATARASQPTDAAKQKAWDQLLTEELSHTLSRHLISGFARIDQEQVLAPYVDRYLDVLDDVWEQRSLDWAIEFSTGTFPHWAASQALVTRVDVRLSDDLPRPLRRVLLEERDTLMRSIAGRRHDADAD
ncbi:MAG: aminopeptidase N, partial [Nitriliruptoraceae bacterium]